MYKVVATGKEFAMFMDAVRAASPIRSEVVDSDGVRRWAPAAPVSAKKMRRYHEQKAAHDAQKCLGR